jgi:hypothetical protein
MTDPLTDLVDHEALAPTVSMLQESAFGLLDRMIAVTEKP